jgi:hypothetical protein
MFKKPTILTVTVIALLAAAALTAARLSAAPSAPLLTLPRAASAGQMTLFGHIRSLTPQGKHFVMRFDPALWLTGVTAQRAAGTTDVPNDYYILDETHSLLTYVVPATAKVTILTHGTNTTPITISRLAHRVASGGTKGEGFWILVGNKYPSPVLSLDQQYQP